MDLTNKTVIVTGGVSGLGLEIARALVAKNAFVVSCGVDNLLIENARAVIASERFIATNCDVTDYTQLTALMGKLKNVDILVNCAGVWLEGNILENSPEEIANLINVNLTGVILTTKAVLTKMRTVGVGTIVNVGSINSFKPNPNHSVYAASKYGIRGFTEALQLDTKNTGVKVIGFYPGGINTDFFARNGSTRDVSQFIDPGDLAKTVIHILENSDTMNINQVIIDKNS